MLQSHTVTAFHGVSHRAPLSGVHLALGLACLASLFCMGPALAQARRPAIPAAEPPLTEVDPYLQELIRRSRISNQGLAESIRDALRLNLNPLADQFLSSVAGRNPAPAELASMAQVISTERLLRVMSSLELSDNAKKQADTMLSALRASQQDTNRLQQAIKGLEARSVDQQLASMRTLLAGAEKSIELVSLEAAKVRDPAARDRLLQVLMKLGDGGIDALSQLAIYGTGDIRAGAIQSLARIDAERSKPIAVAMLFDPSANEEAKSFVSRWLLARYPKLPPQSEAELYLLDRLQQSKEAIRIASGRDGVVMLWALDSDGKSLVHRRVTPRLAAMRNFVDHARLLRQLPGLSVEAVHAGLSAELAYQYEIDPLGIEVERGPILNVWGASALSAQQLDTLLQSALAQNDLAVAISTLHLIDQTHRPEAGFLLAGRCS